MSQKIKTREENSAQHFDSYARRASAEKLGMWLFLATEILMFGGLFAGYFFYQGLYPSNFKAGAEFLNWKKGALNTVILILSSFTMAISIYYLQKNRIKLCKALLAFTLACGLAFMLVKYMEYSHKFHEGIFPGGFFSYSGEGWTEKLPLYFSFYYLMTGLHASHVFIGMALIGWGLFQVHRGGINPGHQAPLEYVGLFWHLVDLIWIFLFPLLYLVE